MEAEVRDRLRAVHESLVSLHVGDVATLEGAEGLLDAVTAAREGDEVARARVVAVLMAAAFRAPHAIAAAFDALAGAWLARDPATLPAGPKSPSEVPSVPLPPSFRVAFDAVIADADGLDALSVTQRVAALGGEVDPGYGALAEAAAVAHPGSADAHRRSAPPRLELATLAAAPPGSLGAVFHALIVENGFDLEVLDRDAIGLAELPPAQRYLNTRILQMHDVWHLVAGYRTTALHEIAISAFQLAQFNHNYSAMFLASVLAIAHCRQPDGFALLAQTVAEAWWHGRSTPPLMAIPWEACWDLPIETLRARFRIEPFRGSFPADLFEQLRAA